MKIEVVVAYLRHSTSAKLPGKEDKITKTVTVYIRFEIRHRKRPNTFGSADRFVLTFYATKFFAHLNRPETLPVVTLPLTQLFICFSKCRYV